MHNYMMCISWCPLATVWIQDSRFWNKSKYQHSCSFPKDLLLNKNRTYSTNLYNCSCSVRRSTSFKETSSTSAGQQMRFDRTESQGNCLEHFMLWRPSSLGWRPSLLGWVRASFCANSPESRGRSHVGQPHVGTRNQARAFGALTQLLRSTTDLAFILLQHVATDVVLQVLLSN